MNTRRRCFTIVFSMVALASSTAWGDRVTRLIQILKTDPSYKVRLQAVISLGKLKDKRAVPSLVDALSDEHYTVRGVSAAALAQLGEKNALPNLKRMKTRESNAFARSQAEKAIKVLSAKGTGPPSGARFFLFLGKVGNKSAKGGKRYAQILGDALIKEFNSVSGVTTDWGGRKPTAAELKKNRLTGFVLDGAIEKISTKPVGSSLEISCFIRVSLATFPGNSMKAFYSGDASMEVSASSFKPEYEDGIMKDIIEGAAQGAREHIARSFFSTQ